MALYLSTFYGRFGGNSSVVEHNLAKVGVASSNLVSRFSFGWMAEWLCSGLQSRGRRFDSGSSLSLARVAEQVDARDLKSLER